VANTLNVWTGIGNIGRDPEIRAFQNGDRIANVSLACTDKWTSRDGEKKERTFWAKIKVTGRKVDLIEQYVKKGDRCLFAGRLEERKWQDKEGNDRFSTEIVVDDFDGKVQFLSSPNRDVDQGQQRSADPRHGGPRGAAPSGGSAGGGGWNDIDDEIPFAPCVD